MMFENLLAERTERMGSSAIREILKIVSQPGMISLAGGIPAPESFPLDVISTLFRDVMAKYGPRAVQYDLTEGFLPLRCALSQYFNEMDINVDADQIMISCGSQGLLDAIGKILISPGDFIAVEAPTYLGAIQAFNPYGPRYLRMDTDEDGLIPESLEELLKTKRVKFIYLVPTFQNPTGRTLTPARRKQVADLLKKHNALLIEDDPYSAIRFSGEYLPSIRSYAPDHVIYAGTFSKILAPGLRIGFFVAPDLIRKWLILAKQGVDLHTSTLNQAIAAEYLRQGHLKAHLPKIIELYRPRQAAMLEAMDRYFPEEFNWSRPEGGMFIWAEGPESMDLQQVYWKAVENNVAFVPGKFFYTDEKEGQATMRLNFTMTDADTITKAVHVLGDVLKQAIKN